MELITDAIVLRDTRYKDSDVILTLFSLERGKITASARGVKKAGAKLSFAAQPFCFAEYVLAQKSGRNTVISASLKDSFYGLRNGLLKFYAACAAAEFCEKVLPDELPSPEAFLMLAKCLSDLSYTNCPERGVLIKFIIDLLGVSGYKTSFSECGHCGGIVVGGVSYFDFEQGCVTCGDCATGRKISQSTLSVICDAENGCYTLPNLDGEQRAIKLLSAYIEQKMDIKIECLSAICQIV